MIELNQLPANISSITKQDWDKLFCLIDEIEKTEMFGKNIVMEHQTDGILHFPFFETSDIVTRFLAIVYELDIIQVFDWMAWQEGENILDNRQQDYNSLDSITLCKLLTTIVRSDRFSEGYISFCFETGVISKILQALKIKTTYFTLN